MILKRIRGIFVLIQFSISVFFVIIFMYIFRNHTAKIRSCWMKLQMFRLGITIKETGTLDTSADLILLNHQSMLDIMIIEHLHSRDIAWVAKKEIAQLPLFGHILKAPRMIIVDRQNKAGLIKLLKDVKDRLSYNRPIAMFPEGTRSDGTKMLKFKTGAKIVANKFNLKVQPIVLLHTRDILDSQKLLANPGTVEVIYLDTIDPNSDKNWYENLEKI